jgi:hypothetical protein
MDNNIEEALWQDYEDAGNRIGGLNIEENVDSFKIAIEDRDKIRNELIKLEQMKNEKEIQNKQLKSDSKKELIRNIFSVGSFIVTTGLSIYTIWRTFKFDESSTITSTLGRGTLNGVIPKLKRY